MGIKFSLNMNKKATASSSSFIYHQSLMPHGLQRSATRILSCHSMWTIKMIRLFDTVQHQEFKMTFDDPMASIQITRRPPFEPMGAFLNK